MVQKAALNNIFGDFVTYRNLEPVHENLKGFKQFMGCLTAIPRKIDPEYADTLLHILRYAQEFRGEPALNNIICIGDTMANDGAVTKALSEQIETYGFIGKDECAASKYEVDDCLMTANKWHLIASFSKWIAQKGFLLNHLTAINCLNPFKFS